MIPDCRERSDFRSFPYPYRLWEGEKPLRYFRKTFLSSVISLGFLGSMVSGVWKEHLIYVVAYLLYTMLGLAIVTMFARKVAWLRIVLHKRIKFLNLKLSEIISHISLRILRPGERVNGKLVLPLMLISYVLATFIVKGYFN
jgi:hypothetical protein